MSADNWTVCPRCWAAACDKHAAKTRVVMATYGIVPVEEFDAARAALTVPARDDFYTFREDYEFWDAETGQVRMQYGGCCTSCGLSVAISDTKRFWGP